MAHQHIVYRYQEAWNDIEELRGRIAPIENGTETQCLICRTDTGIDIGNNGNQVEQRMEVDHDADIDGAVIVGQDQGPAEMEIANAAAESRALPPEANQNDADMDIQDELRVIGEFLIYI
ncbi:hypothetical protein QAD02_013328 [Eretmocerus hayati]|uniref:Uncharacterized protein n=1 Tax=Eretmocerus hayati TaxID=131215 RepID=A0ACC2P294_9HYME|nr:hypothetical protein QAD02_013328 [Eretmocerus hayati]